MAVDAQAVSRWTSSDRLDELLELVHGAFAGLQPPSSVLSETIDDVARRLRDGFALVARADGRLIGSVFAAWQGDALYLTRLAVAPAWRRQGVARALVEASAAEARAAGLARLTLRVRQNLPANRAYFARLGFAVTGEGQDPGRPPYDAMAWVLG
ncbi:MAG: GNAT family N-acetyltransferase [Pseudolabrys sp.]